MPHATVLILKGALLVRGGKFTMNFIEQDFGVSPDNGDGSIEAVILVVSVMLFTSLIGLFLPTQETKKHGSRPPELL
jgi:hypothetical protein